MLLTYSRAESSALGSCFLKQIQKHSFSSETGFAKDATHIFIEGELSNDDPKTFMHICSGYSEAQPMCFFYGNIVQGADPQTFVNGDIRQRCLTYL